MTAGEFCRRAIGNEWTTRIGVPTTVALVVGFGAPWLDRQISEAEASGELHQQVEDVRARAETLASRQDEQQRALLDQLRSMRTRLSRIDQRLSRIEGRLGNGPPE